MESEQGATLQPGFIEPGRPLHADEGTFAFPCGRPSCSYLKGKGGVSDSPAQASTGRRRHAQGASREGTLPVSKPGLLISEAGALAALQTVGSTHCQPLVLASIPRAAVAPSMPTIRSPQSLASALPDRCVFGHLISSDLMGLSLALSQRP